MYNNTKKTGPEFRYPGLLESSASISNTPTKLNLCVSSPTLWIQHICSHRTVDELWSLIFHFLYILECQSMNLWNLHGKQPLARFIRCKKYCSLRHVHDQSRNQAPVKTLKAFMLAYFYESAKCTIILVNRSRNLRL